VTQPSQIVRRSTIRRVGDPLILVVDDDPDSLGTVESQLRERYDRHYRIQCCETGEAALRHAERAASEGEDVALVVVGPGVDRDGDGDVLLETRRLHPHARRALLVEWAETGLPLMADSIFEAIATGRIDHYLIRPLGDRDEVFQSEVQGLLLDWTDARLTSPYTIYVVGDSWSGRTYELREALGRCAMPHTFCLADSDQGRDLLARAGVERDLPVVIFPNGNVLKDPSNVELALAAGSPVNPDRIEFDLVIVGAGPAGLSAAVYGASEGFSTLVVDEGGIGGQSTSSSLIRNYLGFPRGVSGRRLAQSAYRQAWVFGAKFAFMQRVTDLRADARGLSLSLSYGAPVRARAVLLAGGATYRRLGVESLEALTGYGVYYGNSASEAPALVGRDVFVVGGANSAGQAALYLARFARRVTPVVRAGSLDAGMSHYLVQLVTATANIDVRVGTSVVDGGGEGHLDHLVLSDEAGNLDTVPADALFAMIGARPHTDWLPPSVRRDDQGFVMTGPAIEDDWPLGRRPFLLETSLPGVFAAGDVRYGSVKRVASAVGEGSVAIQMLHEFFAGDERYPHGRDGRAAGPLAAIPDVG
jgi:thioredoxin reductase (NADPH)